MVPAAPLRRAAPDTKAMVARAIEAAGGQAAVARACKVTRQRVAQWANPQHPALPNLGHMLALASFGRSLGQGMVDHLDDAAVILALGEAELRREFIRANTRGNDLLLAFEEAVASADRVALREVQAKTDRLADHVRRISRALASMGAK